MSLTTFRMNYRWPWVEDTRGQYHADPALDNLIQQTSAQGIHPLIVLGLGNSLYDGGGMPLSSTAQDAFARYAAFLAAHYRGQVKYYEVWNEWNAGAGSVPRVHVGDPVVYTSLLAKVHAAIKAVDPSIIVLGGAMVGPDPTFTTGVLQAGALKYMDGFSLHPYNYPLTPEQSLAYVQDFEAQARAANAGREVPIYVSEIGWPTYSGPGGVSSAVAGNYLARFYLLSPTYGFIKAAWWYDLRDDGTDTAVKEYTFGLTLNNYTPKPAGCAMADVAKVLAGYRPVAASKHTSGMWVAKFTNGTESLFAVWTQGSGVSADASISTVSPSGARLDVRGICRTLSVTANGSTLVRTAISNAPAIFTTIADNISLQWGTTVFTTAFSSTSGATDTTPPAVTSKSPLPGATAVPVGSSISATFSEPVQQSTIGFTLKSSSGATVAANFGYSSSTATLQPTALLAPSTTYTATVTGAQDASGNIMAAPVSWSFTTAAASAPVVLVQSQYSIWPSTAKPVLIADPDTKAVETGLKFRSDVDGVLTGIRFYKSSSNTGTHVAHLWTATGTLLASATFVNESASGWQQVNFTTPVAITSNTTYIASYHSNGGHYADDVGYFATTGIDNGPLHALKDGAQGPNGVYAYGANAVFPVNGYQASNYWVDVVFKPCPCTIFPSTAIPAHPSDTDTSATELGVKFRADVKGSITGIRFYKSTANAGTHVASLWTSTGTLLARANFTSETGSGWQQVNLVNPVAIVAGTTYVASYHTSTGHYAGDNDYFAAAGIDNAPLHALKDGGVYSYSISSAFPVNTYRSSNYWVDVVFRPQ